ncbi:alpha/beta fold hydrolase [Nocardioides sp. SYSU DS0651]|uniref:alpha/beta fold hydrolase n=1 Tax=Nocardioides sp. SYSU DS0651 TaxID=3415955 RepID=UPI003F4BCE04
MHEGRAEALSVPTVVLVPGLGLGPEAWAPTLRHTRYDARSVVHRLPGYGRPYDHDDLHPQALARRLLDELDGRVDGDLVLVGHSASCQVVAHAAALAPRRTRGLVLVGPTTDPRAASWPDLAGRWLRTAAHETPRQVPTLVRQYRRTTLRTMRRAMDVARRDPIERLLADWSGPVLVVRGRHDAICPEEWGAALARLASYGAVVTLPRGGHMVPLTHGELVAPLLDRAVSRVGHGPARG